MGSETETYNTGHYLISSSELKGILDSLKTSQNWNITSLEGSVIAISNLSDGGWMHLNFFRFSSGEKYIMEGEGFYIARDKWPRHFPSEVKEILVSNKPIRYRKYVKNHTAG